MVNAISSGSKDVSVIKTLDTDESVSCFFGYLNNFIGSVEFDVSFVVDVKRYI